MVYEEVVGKVSGDGEGTKVLVMFLGEIFGES